MYHQHNTRHENLICTKKSEGPQRTALKDKGKRKGTNSIMSEILERLLPLRPREIMAVRTKKENLYERGSFIVRYAFASSSIYVSFPQSSLSLVPRRPPFGHFLRSEGTAW
jgi:hypothetical protein